MKAYLDTWKRYADFSGRTNRRDYWVACITHIGIYFLFALVGGILCILIARGSRMDFEQMLPSFRLLTDLFASAYLIPYLAMTVRRVRDAGYPAKLLLLWIIPPAGFLALFVRLFMKSADAETAINS